MNWAYEGLHTSITRQLCIIYISVTVFLFSTGHNYARRIMPADHASASDVQVKIDENQLELLLPGFSWHFVAILRRRITGRFRLGCYPLLPTCMPLGRKVTLHVHLYKAHYGMPEVDGMFDILLCITFGGI